MSMDNELVAALVEALQWQEMADADPAASHRKGYFEHACDLRRAELARAQALTGAAGKGGES